MNPEQFPNNAPEDKEEGKIFDKLKRVVNTTVAATFIAGASGMAPTEAGAQDKVALATPVSEMDKSPVKGNPAERMEESATSYIKGLGMFGKLGLVNDIKENGEAIKLFLKDGGIHDTEKTQSLFGKGGAELKTVLSIYVRGLKDIEKSDPQNFRGAVSKITDLISTIQNSSISELKDRFK